MNKQSKKKVGKRPTLAEACHRENVRLSKDPNVLCVGYGLRERAGKLEMEACLTYYVYSKFDSDKDIKACGSAPIPADAEGYPTDVVVVHDTKPAQCPDSKGAPTGGRGGRQEDPLVGGTSSTVLSDWHSFPTGYGTLGGICFDATTGDAMALSNAHVWGEDTGKDVIQPWMPIDEYVEGALKLLLCGVTSYLIDWTAPSPATIGLGAAAAAVWIAAACSDEEDPSRWGQRVTGSPGGGALTDRESIHIQAEVPPVPFAGRAYKTKTRWDYKRITNVGDTDANVTEDRVNKHILVAKRVWTDEPEYDPGSRVRICAELVTQGRARPEDYFVVAHCYPHADPSDVYRRVLLPGSCRRRKDLHWFFYGFPRPAEPKGQAPGHIKVKEFEIANVDGTHYWGPLPDGDPNAVTALTIPQRGLYCAVPPCTEVVVKALHTNRAIKVEAFNSAGVHVGTVTGTGEQRIVQDLRIQAIEITTLKITGGGGEGHLLGISARQTFQSEYQRKFNHLHYHGTLDLGVGVDPDQWNIVLYVQTVDNSAKDEDPIKAAQNIGGLVTSANVSIIGCTTIMLLDHVFDVI